MTSVIDKTIKVSEYLLTCRNRKNQILHPDIIAGAAGFSVSEGTIRYELTAIKGVGLLVIESIVEEREARGNYSNLKDFVTRTADKDVNKRAIENFIKAGAFDQLGGTRKQFMSIYVKVVDSIQQGRKNNLAGQISLFDLVEEEAKENFDIKLPDV